MFLGAIRLVSVSPKSECVALPRVACLSKGLRRAAWTKAARAELVCYLNDLYSEDSPTPIDFGARYRVNRLFREERII